MMWAEILTLTLVGPIHLQAHEGAHALTAQLKGYDVLEYKAYPHKENDNLVFGSVTYTVPHGQEPSKLVAMSPYLLDASMFIATDILIHNVKMSPLTKRLVMIAGMLAPLINSTYNIYGYYLGNNKLNDFRDVGSAERLAALTLVNVGVIRLLYLLVSDETQ